MVCSADDLLSWKDFPKGLRVLLLDEDNLSASEIKSKLEQMEYIVSTFYNENEALAAISDKAECYHVAIVEVSRSNSDGRFRFLETATNLPTVVISNIHCLNTMMKCIALGAAEFLQKPLSEDKLRNIWQHVVHKAFNAGKSGLSKSLKPIKETVASMLQLQSDSENYNCEKSLASDKYPAPSTPTLEQGRSLDIGECREEADILIMKTGEEHDQDKESVELQNSFEPKFVENTCTINSDGVAAAKAESPCHYRVPALEEQEEATESSHSQNCIGDNLEFCQGEENKKHASSKSNSRGTVTKTNNKKKAKVDWTPELHRRFVQAVEQLGIDQAIPSKILELMKVEGLTRHNVASHLQKYRMHKRHIMPKDEERKWAHHKVPTHRAYNFNKPLMAYPPCYSNCGLPSNQIYPVWGHPTCPTSNMQMWAHSNIPTWQNPNTWLWKTPYPQMHADAWGCPVVPFSGSPFLHNHETEAFRKPVDLHPAEEVIDKVVKEVINQPWLPLPLGLKPPSTDGVLSELQRQGIKNIPPPSHTH